MKKTIPFLLFLATFSLKPSSTKPNFISPRCLQKKWHYVRKFLTPETEMKSNTYKKRYGLLVPALHSAKCSLQFDGGMEVTNLRYKTICETIACTSCNYKQSFMRIPLIQRGSPTCDTFFACQTLQTTPSTEELREKMQHRGESEKDGLYVECTTCRSVEFIKRENNDKSEFTV